MFTFDEKRVPHGFGLMCWVLGNCGGVAGVVAKARQYGLDGIFLKGADGDSVWSATFNAGIVKQFHDAGLSVIGWHYVYGGPGNGAPAWSSVAGEIAAAKYILSTGADGYLFDDEVELDNKPGVVVQYGQALRAAYPNASIGYNPFPYPSSDVSQPFFEFNNFCDYAMPQLYVGQDGFGTPAAAIARMQADFAKWSAVWAARPGGRPAIPLCIDWQGASWAGAVQPDAYISDAARVSVGQVPLITYWDMDSLTPGEWAAVGQASSIFKGGNQPVAITIDRDAQGDITGAHDQALGTHVGAGIAKVIDAQGWTNADLAVGEMFGLAEGVTGAVLRGSTKQVVTWSAANGATVYANDIADLVQDLYTALQAAKSQPPSGPPINVQAILADLKAISAAALDATAKLPAA